MKRPIRIVWLGLLCAATMPAHGSSGGAYEIEPQAMGSGLRVEGDVYSLRGILGSPDLPDQAGGVYELDGGLSFAWQPSVVATESSLHTHVAFRGPAPNPTSGSAAFFMELPLATHVRGAVFSIDGRRVRTLTDRLFAAGRHSLQWNGDDETGRPVASGVYFVRLQTATQRVNRRVVLIQR